MNQAEAAGLREIDELDLDLIEAETAPTFYATLEGIAESTSLNKCAGDAWGIGLEDPVSSLSTSGNRSGKLGKFLRTDFFGTA